MVFPSLMFNVEPGIVSQFSALAVIGFSFLLHRVKKVILVASLVLAGIFAFNTTSHAFMAYPSQSYNNFGPYQTFTQNNLNYYGQPIGYAPPAYFYPQLQYHSLWGPQQPYYFNPHPQSPYAPVYNCPFCTQPQAPQFPFPVMHPGGGAS
jgi:hypothetical protein